jgi:hypothetical protein
VSGSFSGIRYKKTGKTPSFRGKASRIAKIVVSFVKRNCVIKLKEEKQKRAVPAMKPLPGMI